MACLRSGKRSGSRKKNNRRVGCDDVQLPSSYRTSGEARISRSGVGRRALACDGGEAGEHRGLLADLREDLGLGERVMSCVDGEYRGRRNPCVHAALGNHFAGEWASFRQPDILPTKAGPRGPAVWIVQIVRDRRARCMGQRRRLDTSFIGCSYGFLLLRVCPLTERHLRETGRELNVSIRVAMTLVRLL